VGELVTDAVAQMISAKVAAPLELAFCLDYGLNLVLLQFETGGKFAARLAFEPTSNWYA
jgi:hypothetical protein